MQRVYFVFCICKWREKKTFPKTKAKPTRVNKRRRRRRKKKDKNTKWPLSFDLFFHLDFLIYCKFWLYLPCRITTHSVFLHFLSSLLLLLLILVTSLAQAHRLHRRSFFPLLFNSLFSIISRLHHHHRLLPLHLLHLLFVTSLVLWLPGLFSSSCLGSVVHVVVIVVSVVVVIDVL